MIQQNRRQFMSTVGSGIALSLVARTSIAQKTKNQSLKAIAFDAFPIFDPRPIAALAEQLFPGKGAELSSLWRTRQFEYTWLRTLSNRYVDFRQVTNDALVYAAGLLKLDLDNTKRESLVHAHSQLKAWPDVLPALQSLKSAGVRLGFLSNFTRHMLDANIANAGLQGVFDEVLSTDLAKAFKPDPRAYELAVNHFKLRRQQIVFAAFAGWDAAGAQAFGFPTFWVNRQNAPREELGSEAILSGGINDLVKYALGQI